MYLKELTRELAIREDLLCDLNKRLKVDVDYSNVQHSNGYKRYKYSTQGIRKIKKMLKELTSLRERVKELGIYLGYDLATRKEPNIWVYYGFIKGLLAKGYGNSEIAFIIRRDRTTIVTSKERFPTEKNIIPYLVFDKAYKTLEAKL